MNDKQRRDAFEAAAKNVQANLEANKDAIQAVIAEEKERHEAVRDDFRDILNAISDVLEGGDVRLEFDGYPAYQAVLDCINAIVSQRLRDMKATDELVVMLESVYDKQTEGSKDTEA